MPEEIPLVQSQLKSYLFRLFEPEDLLLLDELLLLPELDRFWTAELLLLRLLEDDRTLCVDRLLTAERLLILLLMLLPMDSLLTELEITDSIRLRIPLPDPDERVRIFSLSLLPEEEGSTVRTLF